MNIASALRGAAGGTGRIGAAMSTFEGVSYGAGLAGAAAGRVRASLGTRDAAGVASSMRGAAKSADDLDGSLQSSAGSANKLSGALGRVTDNLRQNYKAYLSWAAIGGLVGSALSDLSHDADRVVESYYSMGESMNRARGGMKGLIKDTWNLSKMSGDLEMVAARMNLPAEAAKGLTDKLLRSVRTFYGVNGNIRRDMLGDAAKQILAFSRITGASVDQSTDLYAKMTNQYGRSHRGAISGMQALARAGQLVNEELHDMGKDGGVFMEDLVGIVNDASGAFEGFTLNIEHLASRTAHAVKIGQQLGMSYNQAADTAKQMTAIFAKPGGYVGFQAGEQLRQDIQKTLAGLSDTEDRARALSSKYGINIAQGRTLDIAHAGPNAQMNVMEVLKGTSAGMEKSFTLMQEQARNNSMSTDVFKQFVGGENLTTEQAGDLMQMLRDQNSTFGDFQRHLERTKREASADKVIEGSVLVPTMIKEWIKGTSGAMKMNIAAALTGVKFGLIVFGILKFVSISVFIWKAIKNMGQVLRNIDSVLTKHFGKRYTDKRDAVRNGLASVKQGASSAWGYLRSGQLFTDAKHFFASTKNSLLNLVDMFRSGRASVMIRGYGRQAWDKATQAGAAMRGYGQQAWDRTAGARAGMSDKFNRLRERGAAYGATARDYVVAKSASTQEALRRQHETAVAAFERVRGKYTGADTDPAIVRYRHKMVQDTKQALDDGYRRSRVVMGGVVNTATESSRRVAAFAKREWAKREHYQEEALRAGTTAARTVRDAAVRQSRRIRGRVSSTSAAAATGSAGDAAAGVGDAAGILAGAGVGGGMFGVFSDLLSMGGGLFGGGSPAESVAGHARAGADTARKLGRRGLRRTRVAGGRGMALASDLHTAIQPTTKNLSIAARLSAFFNGNIKTDAIKGLGAAVSKSGSVRRRALRGVAATAGSWAGRNLAKAGSFAAGAAALYSVYSMLNPGDNENGEEGETVRAGGRKYDDKIKDQTEALDALSEQLDVAKLAGDEAMTQALQREYDAQKKLLHVMDSGKEKLDAQDRQITENEGRIEKLKKARDRATNSSTKNLLSKKIDALEAQNKGLESAMGAEGATSTSKSGMFGKFASMGTAAMIGVPLATGLYSKVAATGIGGKMIGKLAGSKIGTSLLGRGIGGFMGSKAGALLGKVGGPALGGLITALQTEGDWKRRLFTGAVTGLGSAGAAALGTAIAGPMGGIAGGVGANMYLSKNAAGWYDNLFGDKNGASPTMARPGSEPGGSMAGSNSAMANVATGRFTSMNNSGQATMIVTIPGFAQVVDKANTINDKSDTGVSGGW